MSQLAKNDYELSKQDAFSPNLAVRLKRAKDQNTHPEILYFLASDDHPKVRKAVAKNKSTPYHTIKVLSEDSDEAIRKIAVKLLGAQLHQQDQKPDSKKTFILNEIIEMLSQDQSSQIRQVLSETITEIECIPHHIALKIASDVSEKVSSPMLKEFKKFSDSDLISILENHDELWRFETIAERQEVSLKLANFLIDAGYVSVVKKLLSHQRLELSEPELAKIVKLTERHESIEKHIVNYRALPGKLAKKLVQFVGKSVLRTLIRRNDFDTLTIGEIKRIAQRRLTWLDEEKQYPDPRAMAIALYQKDGLTEEMLTDALSWRKSEFVMIALTLLADSTYDAVSTIFRIKSQKAIMALSWYIDFSAKFGVLLQKKIAGIHPRDILHAREAVDYPLTKDEMEWQLDFFDIL